MASPGPGTSDSQLESSMESFREAPIDVGILEEVDGRGKVLQQPVMQKDDSRIVILNGLQLSLKKHKQAFAAYHYSLTPLMESPVKIDWKVLTAEGVECQHIRYHQLQHGDNITTLASTFKKSHAVGVILVNVEDSTELSPEFLQESQHSMKTKKSSFPVILISSSDGHMLQEALNHNDPGEIHARIEHKNQPDVKLLQRRLPAHSPTTSARSTHKRHSLRGSLRLASKRGMEINLKDMVKQMMLPITGPQCVSEDLALFQHLMSAFYQYEQMVEREREGPRNEGAVFRKLTKHMEEMFEKDFPFHITVAYRVHKKQQFYFCDELIPFVQSCISQFEKLAPRTIAATMEAFLKQDNFRIMIDPSSIPTVFELMEESCVELMKLSAIHKNQDSGGLGQLSHRQLYCRMLWISVAYKCHVERGTRVSVDYWREHLTSKHKLIFLNTDTIQSIRKGVEFGRQLELPDRVAFGSELMAELLAAKGSIRPFNQIREFVVVLEQYIKDEDEFLVNLIQRPRQCYKACFTQTSEDKLRAVHPDGNLLVILQEGILLLDSVLGVSRKRSWHSSMLDEEIKQWLSVLLHLVDITSDRAESYLKDFLTTKSGGVTKQYREHIKRGIICKVQENLNRLGVEQFCDLYQAFLIWPTWLVEEYLRQYRIPQDVKICSLAWRDLFSEFVDRFTDARHHKSLLEFLQSVAVCYLKQCRAKDFILDLLQLDVPTLFVSESEGSTSTLQSDIVAGSVSDEFSTFLSEYIQRNNLRKAILANVESIWDTLAEHNEFQQLILIVLQQELIPESSVLKGALMAESSIRFLIDNCVTTICKEIGCLQEVSSRLSFCWGVLASCCNRIPISDTFEWINLFTFVVDQLGRVYGMYCQYHSLSEEESVLKESNLPNDMADSPCEEVRSVFKWVCHAQSLLVEWTKKFSSREINYDEIQLYHKNFSTISRVASLFYANAEMTDMANLSALTTDFNQSVELLNIFMIRYVPGKPELGWCGMQHLLATYGIGLPTDVLTTLTKYVVFPGESCSEDKLSLTLSCNIPAAISKNFQPGLDVSLQITRELSLRKLKQLVQTLAAFLVPVEDSMMQMLVFFYLNESRVFDKYLRLQLSQLDSVTPRLLSPASPLPLLIVGRKDDLEMPQGIVMDIFAEALCLTKKLLLNFIAGNATYTDIIADGSPDLISLNIDHEFKILKEYAELNEVEAESLEGLIGFKAMLQLFQLTRHIRMIHSVCVQYQLKHCLEDSKLKDLTELVDTLEVDENKRKLTTKDAIKKMQVVQDALCLNDKMDLKFLNLFTAIADSAVFHQFVTEKQFIGEGGQALFYQQYQLIITQLQHEEYNEAVLNNLFAAFKLITPFVDREQTFTSLMSQVASLGAVDASRQLETVNRNINLIRLWFSRAEGDTLEGVANELRCVLDTGYYQFSLILTSDGVQGSMELLYRRSVYCSMEPGEEGTSVWSRSSYLVEQKWSEEQINDFVRKLGFLDAEGETGVKIGYFLYLSQIAKKMISLYIRLRDLGHPDYLKPTLSHNHILPCSISKVEADQKVQQISVLLADWEEQMTQLHIQYEQLLFFSIPKLLHLYELMMSKEIDDVAKEVGFLFQNKPDVQQKLRETVEGLLKDKKFRRHHTSKKENTPIHTVGAFLSELFRNFELSSYSLKKRRPSMPVLRSLSPQSTHILHSCQGYNQSQIVRLIISIYGGVPEAFEVFQCRPNTTKEEILLFLNPKRATKRPFQYLIIEVNKLPYYLQEVLLQLLSDWKQQHAEDLEVPCVHFIETEPSMLHEMPYVLHRDYKGQEPTLDFSQAMMTCQRSALNAEDFSCIKLVYGEAGDGKTHYIESQLHHSPHPLRVTVNESFMPLNVIKKLSSLPFDVRNCAVFFNISLLPPGESVDEAERQHYEQLLETVGWFFFDLFILGYVEDPVTGHSFRFPGGMTWAIYVEVPTRNQMNAEESLEEFFEDFPALGMLGTPYQILPDTPYVIDEDAQLVSKYLRAYDIGGTKGIDRLYKEGSGFLIGKKKPGNPVKFSLEPDLSEEECRRLLGHYTPPHMMKNKATRKLFVKYMKRRCEFLDNCPAFNYNSGASEYVVTEKGERQRNDTTQLGSTLMHAMLNEVSDFCDPIIRENWALKPHHQLIYDFKDGGASFGLISLHPEQISDEDVTKFRKIGVEIPSMMELYSRDKLDSYLSRALNLPLENGKLGLVDDCAYVLTLDFAIKMLNIHERAECRVPVIIEGETGVGKTALVEMLSKLWNCSLTQTWKMERSRMVDFIARKVNGFPKEQLESYPGCLEAIAAMTSGEPLREDELILIGELPDKEAESGQFYSVLRTELLKLIGNPVLSLIQLREEEREMGVKFSRLFAAAEYKNNAKDTAKLLHSFLNAEVKSTFHKLNVHAALQPEDVVKFFEPVFNQAKDLSVAYEGQEHTRVPFVTVFLDEINTSSCLGLFKEVIVDRMLCGELIPHNLFIIGACNPHRGNSLASHDTWIQGSYYVRLLHPTLQCLMWDYGALGESQERDYIQAKLKMSNQEFSNVDLATLTNLIVTSQNQMRAFALRQMKKLDMTEQEASACSRSCVSQRDIQRVFTFYKWLHNMYDKFSLHGADRKLRAVLVALGLVYYLRLDSDHRKKYQELIDHHSSLSGLTFSKAFEQELNWYISRVDLPEGIAKTEALKENLFATIICTMTHTPLIIVGSPGSSKTLSFSLTIANMKGQESKVEVFRTTDVFKSLDPQVYQCSRRTTSNEIQTVFSRAINRQRSHAKVPLPVYCVVFMDEAGLPEERHESLKALHYYLDSQEVSFVAISNHVLDAAKTNRAVSLFRPAASSEDLITLAKGCLHADPDNPPPTIRKDIEMVSRFCGPYEEVMTKKHCKQFFGLRDFIHFISYLRHKRHEMLSPQLVMEGLERNFNGIEKRQFFWICQVFLQSINSSLEAVTKRNILEILQSSLKDHPTSNSGENQMRYKLIIDASEDGSLMRLLFAFGVLQRKNTRVYVLSDFPGDAHLQKINTIAAIRHSATEGHTILMNQTDAIHESFYDLFNHRFHRIDASSGPRFYANIAIGAHIKPCRIHHTFQCVVVVKKSELDSVPPPFLNRFEKYLLSHKLLLEAALNQLPPFVSRVILVAKKKASEFVQLLGGPKSVYGYHSDTLNALILTLLPPTGFQYEERFKPLQIASPNLKLYLLKSLLQALQDNAGFHIPSGSPDELKFDAEEVLKLVLRDSEFAGYCSQLSCEKINEAIMEGLHVLYYTIPPTRRESRKDVSVGGCLVIQVLSQWLTRYLCKKIMQLTTSEAVCIHQKKFPTSYVQSYLNYQHHFCLKSLLESHHAIMNSKQIGTCPTKLVCFTRSSQLLHQIPATFPSSFNIGGNAEEETNTLMGDLFFSDPRRLQVHKLSSVSSYTSMKEVLKKFSSSDTQSVLLLIVNMQETSRSVVNHIRIMIEEVENDNTDMRKLYAMILHFPASVVSTPCYHALFLQGWDFHYLDVIGCSPKGDILDIRDWFRQCYFTQSTLPSESVSLQLNSFMREAVTAIASRVLFGSDKSSSFNRPMTLVERSAILEEFLLKKGTGDILIERFNSYWQPSVMVEYLEKAARFAHQHEATASIIDSLQSIFKRLFFDFLVYIISKINEGMNIDVIFDVDCTPEVHQLFLDILRVYPIPKLSELKMCRVVGDSFCLDQVSDFFSSPRFPFFITISSAVEKVVDQCQREINQHVDMLSDQPEPCPSLFQTATMNRRQTMKNMVKKVQSKLKAQSECGELNCLVVALQALLRHESLWQKYLEDFTHHKLHLDLGNPGISRKIMLAAFGKLEEQDQFTRLAVLHAYMHVHKLNLARVASVLRPLDKIEVTASILLSLSDKIPSPAESFLHDVEDSGDFLGRPEALSIFIIDTLFSAISGVAMKYNSEMEKSAADTPDIIVDHLKLWFKAYRDVMAMPTLQEHIYRTRSVQAVQAEAQHNLMHVLFLVMRCRPDGDYEIILKGLRVFSHLLKAFFKATCNMELCQDVPRLKHVATVVLKVFTGSESLRIRNQIEEIMEGLFAHFFSEHQSSYHVEDIRWFLEIANLQSQWQVNYLMNEVIDAEYTDDLLSRADFSLDATTEPSSNCWSFCASMSTFKFYLLRILRKSARTIEDSIDSVMLFFKKNQVHDMLSDQLLFGDNLGPPQPYIPTFYQFCGQIGECLAAESKLMQQPLAHLYFLAIFDDLLHSEYNMSALINAAQSIGKQCHGGSVEVKDVLLLHIENQAIVQVVIKELAQHLNLKEESKVNVVCTLLSDINEVLDNESMGGGSIKGHSQVLVMHMLKELQSFQAFSRILTDQYNLLCDGIHCLEEYHQKLTMSTRREQQADEVKSTSLDFGHDFRQFCSRVSSTMHAVHTSSGSSSKVKELVRLAEDFSDSQVNITTASGSSYSISRLSAFKIAVWLCVYNDFFSKKKSSPRLKNVIKNNLSSHFEGPILNLLLSFLNFESLLHVQAGTEKPDPIYSLFMPSPTGVEDHDVADLRAALVKLIAIVLGSSPEASHLWFHMFKPEELQNTYLTGFMACTLGAVCFGGDLYSFLQYGAAVGPDSYFYDQGVELTQDGLYGQHGYLKHATRGTLSLHSLYLLLWVNFGAFCVNLMICRDGEDMLSGKILSASGQVRHYCASYVHKLWVHLKHCLAKSSEERAVLVELCLVKHFELVLKSSVVGRFQSLEALDRYEEQWHASTFLPVWKNLRSQLLQQCQHIQNEVYINIQSLDGQYPWFPDEKSLIQAVLSEVHISSPEGNDLYALSQFVMEYHRLKLGSDLLPGILELYQWLHTELAYAVTFEDATKITLGRLAKVVAKRMPGRGDSSTQYESLKAKFNEYAYLTGCTQGKRPAVITDSTPLLHLLSYSMGGEQGNDLLYSTITDIIAFHNHFLNTLLEYVQCSSSQMRYFPDHIPCVHAMEFTQHYGLAWNSESLGELLQLIHKRSQLPTAYPVDPKRSSAQFMGSLPGNTTNMIDLSRLQEDILSIYIAGKPVITESSICVLRIAFKFKEKSSLASLQLSLHDYSADMETISRRLPDTFKMPLSDSERKHLEYEFHSAGYHLLLEMITGLHTVMGHLVRELPSDIESSDHTSRVKITDFKSQSLAQFLIQLYRYNSQDDAKDIFHEIGIHSLTSPQHSWIASLSLTHIFETLQIFVCWAEEGWYDFCSIPYAAKMPMSLPDEDAIRQIPQHYEGSTTELLKDIKSFMDALVHLEGSVAKILPQCSQVSVVNYLKKLQLYGEQDKLISMIPDTIRMEHYVSLRLLLRRLYTGIQKQIDQKEIASPEPKEEWSDFIDQLWDSSLPYCRQGGYVHGQPLEETETPTGSYSRSSEILNELIHYSSESSLLELQEAPLIEVSPTSLQVSHSDETSESEAGVASFKHTEENVTSFTVLDVQDVTKDVTVNKVIEFLIHSKLEQYVDAFEEYEIDGELLIQASDEELEEIGVSNPLHRLKIRIGFRRFVIGSKGDVSMAYPASKVAKILSESKQLKQFARAFAENDIDGELLLNASDSVMRQLGVSKGVHMRMIRLKFRS